MIKQVQSKGFAAFAAVVLPVAMLLLAGIQTADAKQCRATMPSSPQGHWTYRLIDGRKCWYEGENNFPKALLQWPEQTDVLSAFDKMEPPTMETMGPPAAVQTLVPQAAPNDQPDSASFDARWRALDMTQLRN